jgi:Xaa-Pro aminopeptidase
MKRIAPWIVLALFLAGAGIAAAQPAPLDPYAPAGAPTPVPAPAPTGSAPVDPYAGAVTPTPVPAPKGGAPVDPYATPAPAPTPAPGPKPAPVAPLDPYASVPAPTGATPPPPSAEVTTAPGPRLDVSAVQGLLEAGKLDGWLLADLGGQNPVALTLVAATGAPTRRWFYLIPRTGEPTLLCHVAEAGSFAALPGRHLTYNGYRDLAPALKALLKGKKSVAMEYSPSLPNLSRVDTGTLDLVRATKTKIASSEVLVQFVKATWGPQGRRSHYVAVHHLVELRKEAIGLLRARLAAGAPVTEYEVQAQLAKGMAMRGLVGPSPVVAFGAHAADPHYVAPASGGATLQRGDVVLVSLAGKIEGGVFAAQTWVAVADRAPSIELRATFDAVAAARDAALATIRDRLNRRRSVQGWEVDRAARDLFTKGGLDSHALHRTGHSLDNDLQGSGTDLDDLEVKDSRNLVVGTGFTVGPGLYYPDGFGVRSEISVFLGKDGVEITTPVQDQIEPLLGP